MRSNEEILKEIDFIKNDETELYSYLYDMVYNEWSKDVSFLEATYNLFLEDRRCEIRRISIYSLLFGLKIQKEKYKTIALTYASDINSSFDMRLMCISSLAEAYTGMKDKKLLSFFWNIYFEDTDDEDMKDLQATAFIGMMKQLGMSSVEILRQNGALILTLDDLNEEQFITEIDLIRSLIS